MSSTSRLHSVLALFSAYLIASCMSVRHDQFHSSKAIAKGVDLRILPLGDSITWGEGSTDGNGYRLALSKLLAKHGNKLNYIGSVQSGTMVNNDHEGHGGYQIIAVGLTGKPDYRLQPNVVLLMAGTNDIVFNTEIDKAPNRLGGVIQDVVAACPDAAVLVATLTPLLNPGWTDKIVDFNSAVPGIVTELANKGKKVALVDMARVTTNHIDPVGGIHPTDEGYGNIAAAWYDGVLAASEMGWIEKPLRGSSQNQSSELSDQEMKIIENQPETPTLENLRMNSFRTNAQATIYLILLLALIVLARKAAGMITCKLCGVSFNISRMRRVDEPYYTAWTAGESFPGDEHRQENFVSIGRGINDKDDTLASDGCQNRLRRFLSAAHDTDDEDDRDYVYQDDTDSDRLEYDSDEDIPDTIETDADEEEAEDSTSGDPPCDSAQLILSDEIQELHPDRAYPHQVEDPHGRYCKSKEPDDERSQEDDDGHGPWCLANLLEHLAGPTCVAHCGYSGYRISAEEMKGCNTSQCLIRKWSQWVPEEDDQDFELSSDYFLSGLCAFMPSRDDRWPQFIPKRHRMTYDTNADNVVWSHENAAEKPVPFHPTCFELFTRASCKHSGYVDINGLMGWRNLESNYDTDSQFPRHPAVYNGRQQEWNHEPGDEWLAANPVLIPGLDTLLWSAAQHQIADTDRASSKDPFAKVPRELADAIVSFLDPVDVASLRLASCARYLPISDWKARLEIDMPWLWEVWDNSKPSIWVTISHAELEIAVKKMEQADEDYFNNQREYKGVIQEEMPELWEAWINHNSWLNQVPSSDWRTYLAPQSARELPKPLPQAGTNWCRIYYEVGKNCAGLKGLQNRKRIWTDLEEILRRISNYRSTGRIP